MIVLAFCMFHLTSEEKLSVERYAVPTNNNPPYTYVFYKVRKGNVIFYFDKDSGGIHVNPRVVDSDGNECWFDLWKADFSYGRYGFEQPDYMYGYYHEPEYDGEEMMTFRQNDIFLYKMVEYFTNQLVRFESDVSPDYFKTNVLPKVETCYLKYLRNSVFALYGYKFSSSELMQFFSQYTWYAYDSSLTVDKISIFIPSKYVELINIIREEEKRRAE